MSAFKAQIIQPGLSLTELHLCRAHERATVYSEIGGDTRANAKAILKLVRVVGFEIEK